MTWVVLLLLLFLLLSNLCELIELFIRYTRMYSEIGKVSFHIIIEGLPNPVTVYRIIWGIRLEHAIQVF